MEFVFSFVTKCYLGKLYARRAFAFGVKCYTFVLIVLLLFLLTIIIEMLCSVLVVVSPCA